MQADLAAAYLDVSKTKFCKGVGEGRYPKPVKDGGNTLWLKSDLDRWLESTYGVGASFDDFDRGTDHALGKAHAR